jgi:deoxyadenosine/deoxycytidine kinase
MERSQTTPALPPIILVEGNICSGKTTLCRALASELGMDLFLEPVLLNPYLIKYYVSMTGSSTRDQSLISSSIALTPLPPQRTALSERAQADPPRWALPLQLWIVRQRARTYAAAVQRALLSDGPAASGIILDRSLFSDSVFAVKNHLDRNITDAGMEEYETLRRRLLALVPRPDLVVYLEVDATECHRRVHEMRQREGEEGIPLEYLAGLEQCYDDFIAALERGDTMATGSEPLLGKPIKVARIAWSRFGEERAVGATIRSALASAEAAPAQELSRAALAKIERDLEALERALLDSERDASDAAETKGEGTVDVDVAALTAREKAYSRAEQDRAQDRALVTPTSSKPKAQRAEAGATSPSSIAQVRRYYFCLHDFFCLLICFSFCSRSLLDCAALRRGVLGRREEAGTADVQKRDIGNSVFQPQQGARAKVSQRYWERRRSTKQNKRSPCSTNATPCCRWRARRRGRTSQQRRRRCRRH